MSNIAVEQQETIIPFIKICRKLEGCSSFQLSQWVAKFPKIFNDNNCSDLFAKILIKGISHFNKIIPMPVFESIESSSPNENELNINDSITKSDIKKKKKKNNDKMESIQQNENKEKKEALTLLKIPKDLKMLTFNFLRFKDLCSLQKTCRCLNIVSRNPNSLYHLSIRRQSNHYLHPFFSRIKSLYVNYEWRLFNQKWYHTVNSLTLINVEDNQSINTFVKLRQFELCMNAELLINNKINYKTLKRLTIDSCTFDDKLLFALRKCINLERLQLTGLRTNNSFESITNNKDIMSTFDNIKLNPFKKLNHFVIDDKMFKLPTFIYWILCNSNYPKTLNIRLWLLGYSSGVSKLFIKTSKLALLALQNIKHITIGNHSGISYNFSDHLYSLLNNMYESLQKINQNKEFRPFKFDTFDLILRSSSNAQINQQKLDITQSFIPYCDECNLFLDIHIHPQDDHDVIDLNLNKWISNITNGNSKCFNVLQIKIDFAIFYSRRIYDNISNTNKLNEIAKEISLLLLNEYNKWIKPFLCISKDIMKKIGMKSIKIQFGSDYFDDNDYDLLDDSINYSDDEEYAKAYEKRHDIVYKEWMKTIYPSLEQLLTNKFSHLCDVDMTADGFYVTLKLT